MQEIDHPSLWREAAVIALYLSIVLLAEFVALPEDYGQPGHHSASLYGIIWGTAFGLAFAHWFAFQVAAVWFSGGKFVHDDLRRAGAQLFGAAVVAVATTIPVLIVDGAAQVEAAAIAPSLILGASGYLMGRSSQRSLRWSVVVGVLVLAAGLGVAIVKATITNH